MSWEAPLLDTLPRPPAVRRQLGDALREVELLRHLLRLSERAERYRQLDLPDRPEGGVDVR